MPYCLNPSCPNPENPDRHKFCQSCGSKLLLKELYRASSILGQGGFGKTFRAVNLGKFDEPCVIKQFLPQNQESWALQKAVELFNQEARRLYELGKHPQIPELIAYFEQDRHLYLVQELVEGENLVKELERNGAFSENQIRTVLTDLLPVLKFIHEQGVIHRDIKPENIIRRNRDGKLVLIDFGISKQMTQTAFGRPGTIIGSRGYAPIEQMQEGEASPASDLYSLGMTCFHLLTNIHPFQLFIRYGYSWVQNWREYLSNPPREGLDLIIDKLLHPDVNLRYQSADAVLQYLKSEPSILKFILDRYRMIQLDKGPGLVKIFKAEDTWMLSKNFYLIKRFQTSNNHAPDHAQVILNLFQQEAGILEELNFGFELLPDNRLCDRIRKFYGYFEQADELYQVQEWVEGKNLELIVLEKTNLSENLVKEILVTILPVLDYVHNKRIIHRNINPSRIVLHQSDSQPVLDDFGAATRVNSQGKTDGLGIGRLGYMPSEQVYGNPVYSSDLYGLGRTAIYMLTGKYPARLDEVNWRFYAPNVSPKFAAVIDKAIREEVSDRYASAKEMLNDLLIVG